MPLPLLLDSNIMASVVRPEVPANKPIASAVFHLVNDGRFRPCVSEIVDYELRRKLLHLAHHRHRGQVITTNERHFRGIAEIFDWRPYLPSN